MAQNSLDEERKLAEEMKYRLFKNVLFNIGETSFFQKNERFDYSTCSPELKDFFAETGEAEPWLRARVLESVATAVGLDEYISALVRFRNVDPDRIAPINSLFASSHIARSLDFFILEILSSLPKKMMISEEKKKVITSMLGNKESLKVRFYEEVFDIAEIEYIRRVILNKALDLFEAKLPPAGTENRLAELRRIPNDLRPVEKAPDLKLRYLKKLSQRYRNLIALFIDGVLVWQFGNEPRLFVKNGIFHYSPKSSQSRKRTSLTEAREQVRIIKGIIKGMSGADRSS